MSKAKTKEPVKQEHEPHDAPATGAFLSNNVDYAVPNEFAMYTASLPLSGEIITPTSTTLFLQEQQMPLASTGDVPSGQPTVVLSNGLTLEDLRAAMQHFTHERDWDRFHTPRNLLCALVGEVGALSEVFQWRGEVERGLPDFSDEDKNFVAEQLADVLLHLVRLSDVCGFDLGQAAINKLQINAHKYPVEAVRGSITKYGSYESTPRSRRNKYEAPSGGKDGEETSRKRARERFSEDQVAAMTELAEKAEWSITALSWEERMKFCQEYNITKERLCNFFNNRKPKEMKRGRNALMRRASMSVYDGQYDSLQYSASNNAQHDESFLNQ